MIADMENGEIGIIVTKDYCAIIGLNQKDLENQIREVVMNQTTKPAACPDSVRVERIQISHGRAIRVVSVFPKSGSQTAEEKLRVLAALELQRKKSA